MSDNNHGSGGGDFADTAKDYPAMDIPLSEGTGPAAAPPLMVYQQPAATPEPTSPPEAAAAPEPTPEPVDPVDFAATTTHQRMYPMDISNPIREFPEAEAQPQQAPRVSAATPARSSGGGAPLPDPVPKSDLGLKLALGGLIGIVIFLIGLLLLGAVMELSEPSSGTTHHWDAARPHCVQNFPVGGDTRRVCQRERGPQLNS